MTLVDNRSLLGEPSLTQALHNLICDAELIVPVLDAKANRPEWVKKELAIAKDLNCVVIPVVQDEESLPELVKDIPYLSDEDLDEVLPAALRRYALLPMDPSNPCQFAGAPLREYLESTTDCVRQIVDSNNATGRLADGLAQAVECATAAQPDLRQTIEKQV